MPNPESPRELNPRYLADEGRLAALASTGLMDSGAEPSYDRLARLASMFLATPVVQVSLVAADRQYFKSCVGMTGPWAERRATPISHSFCKYVVTSQRPLVINDARLDPLVKDNPAIPDLGVVAYLGIPLVIGGHVIGSFCVIDGKPRDWTDADIETLRDLAESVVTEIRLRIEHLENERRGHLAEAARRRFEEILSGVGYAVIVTDARGDVAFMNQFAEALCGRTNADAGGRPLEDVFRDDRDRRRDRHPGAGGHARIAGPPRARAAGPGGPGRAGRSIADTSRLTGVSRHALVTWERRYGFPTPARSFLGFRRYPEEQVEVIRQIAGLSRSGRAIGEMISDYQAGILII